MKPTIRGKDPSTKPSKPKPRIMPTEKRFAVIYVSYVFLSNKGIID
jgi:hypothetical protein